MRSRRRRGAAAPGKVPVAASGSATVQGPDRSRHTWLLAGVLIGCGVLAYSNSLHSPPVLDDQLTIVENLHIREWWRLDRVLFPERELPIAGRPVVNVSLAINYALGGIDVAGYRIGNILVHLLCALTLLGVVRRACELPTLGARLQDRAGAISFATAAIWLLHPINSEVIGYITQRTESMMALCYLLTMYASLRALASARAAVWNTVAITACALGMGCKESMISAPIMVMLFDRIFVFTSARDAWRARRGLYAGLMTTWVLLATLMWSGPRVHSAGFGTDVSVWTYLLNQTVMICQYLKLAFWPHALVVNYGWPLPLELTQVWPYALGVLVLLAATSAALRLRPQLGFLGAWFFITLAPTSSVLPIATEVGAERRMYLPLMALTVLAVIMAVSGWDRLARSSEAGGRRSRATWATGVLVLGLAAAALGTATFLRNREYSSSLTLATTVLDRWPTSMAEHFIGQELLAAGRRQEGVAHLRQAIDGAPRAHYSLGVELINEGQLDEGIEQLQQFVRRQPLLLEVPSAHLLMGNAYARQQRWPEAIAQARAALMKAPGNIDATALLAECLFKLGSLADAIPAYREYLKVRPADLSALANLGIALVGTDHLNEAVVVFGRAVEVDPRNGAARRNLTTALLDANRVDEAATHAREAVALLPDDPAVYDLLGQALARQGHLLEARAQLVRALQIDSSNAEVRRHLAVVENELQKR